MNQIIKISIILVIAVIVMSTSALTEIPLLINYQGRLLDSAGVPFADGAYLIEFVIWDDSIATNQANEKWSSGFQTINISDGLFTYNLGSDVPLPENLFSISSTRYLGVTQGTNPEMVPRTKLTSVGYAFHALKSDTALNVPPNSIGSAEIKDSSIVSTDISRGAIHGSQIIDGSITGINVATNSIPTTDIEGEAGVELSNITNTYSLNGNWKTVSQLSITAPEHGYVVCIGTGYVDWDVTFFGGTMQVGWTTSSTGTPLGSSQQSLSVDATVGTSTFFPLNSLATFVVNAGTTTTFYFRARANGAAGHEVDYVRKGAVAMFFPTRY